ncbi:hypothetical protein E2C01_018740 [Portunus trituberculatus]|uniref:Uncharacterized protein n=1 Tax=Portunus trituberculatus TaxID=210409 RepID=A0A5B7DVG8_PORTR|nr:hypothetical protein [Portunus trituberculatus]
MERFFMSRTWVCGVGDSAAALRRGQPASRVPPGLTPGSSARTDVSYCKAGVGLPDATLHAAPPTCPPSTRRPPPQRCAHSPLYEIWVPLASRPRTPYWSPLLVVLGCREHILVTTAPDSALH